MIVWKTHKEDKRYLDIGLMKMDYPNDFFECYLDEVEDVEIYYKGKLTPKYNLKQAYKWFDKNTDLYKEMIKNITEELERELEYELMKGLKND